MRLYRKNRSYSMLRLIGNGFVSASFLQALQDALSKAA
jgi:hypothetical protein